MKTVRGIELNINESEYKTCFLGLTFYFSSKVYKEKFENNVRDYINQENIKLELKYKMNLENSLYLAISYYKNLEKRGFRILDSENNEITKDVVFKTTILQR